ncbi:MAG: transposase [Geminicoccaceae bacterium]
MLARINAVYREPRRSASWNSTSGPLARVEGETNRIRGFGEFASAAKTWNTERRVVARVEASHKGVDSRFIVTNLAGIPRWLHEVVYCAGGQAENLVKAHKRHLASDRTSCSKRTANQFRLVLHTAAYWLLHTLRGLAPKRSFWREAQLDMIRLALIKAAGRVAELASRIELALPSDYPYRDSLMLLATRAARPPRAACPQPFVHNCQLLSSRLLRHGSRRSRPFRPGRISRPGEFSRLAFARRRRPGQPKDVADLAAGGDRRREHGAQRLQLRFQGASGPTSFRPRVTVAG